jgi:hypothetical protein
MTSPVAALAVTRNRRCGNPAGELDHMQVMPDAFAGDFERHGCRRRAEWIYIGQCSGKR